MELWLEMDDADALQWDTRKRALYREGWKKKS